VLGADASRAARINVRREPGATGVRGPPAARGPPPTATAARASGSLRPPVVLGENMAGRVIPYAKSVGAETIVDWLGGREWSQQLNDDFIAHIKSEGREVLDIGPDFARRLRFRLSPPPDRGGRPVYEIEREQLGDYPNRRALFQRTGRFSGGVQGLDFPGKDEGGPAGMKP